MAKETFYFSHDYNARNDDKLLEVRDKYKNEGYAVYFYILETMAERGDGYIMPSLIGGLSLGYGVAKEWLKEFLDFCVEINLLNKDENGFFSGRMIEHLNMREMFKQQGIKGAKIRWKNSPPNSKESKVKEKKDIYTHPKLEEVIKYFEDNGYVKSIGEKAFRYYESGDWKDSRGNKVKNWKQKMRGVWFKDENKIGVKDYSAMSDFSLMEEKIRIQNARENGEVIDSTELVKELTKRF